MKMLYIFHLCSMKNSVVRPLQKVTIRCHQLRGSFALETKGYIFCIYSKSNQEHGY